MWREIVCPKQGYRNPKLCEQSFLHIYTVHWLYCSLCQACMHTTPRLTYPDPVRSWSWQIVGIPSSHTALFEGAESRVLICNWTLVVLVCRISCAFILKTQSQLKPLSLSSEVQVLKSSLTTLEESECRFRSQRLFEIDTLYVSQVQEMSSGMRSHPHWIGLMFGNCTLVEKLEVLAEQLWVNVGQQCLLGDFCTSWCLETIAPQGDVNAPNPNDSRLSRLAAFKRCGWRVL